jgi:transcription elongation factor GreA
MPEPSVDPSPPEADESRLTVPLEAQEASYLAASERIARRSFSDFFISLFTKCSQAQSQAIDRQETVRSHAARGVAHAAFQNFWQSPSKFCYGELNSDFAMVPKFCSGTCFFLCPRHAGMSLKDIEMVDKVPMTPSGYTKLQEELRWRQQEERPRIIEAIAEARAHGDLSENAEYHAAKEAQSHNEGRITELEDLTARAEVIDLTKMSGSKIKFGATVKLVDEDTDEEKIYQIVGDQEADVKLGRISISSPIARAMIGKEKGDSIEVVAPGGSKAYEILAVSWG